MTLKYLINILRYSHDHYAHHFFLLKNYMKTTRNDLVCGNLLVFPIVFSFNMLNKDFQLLKVKQSELGFFTQTLLTFRSLLPIMRLV